MTFKRLVICLDAWHLNRKVPIKKQCRERNVWNKKRRASKKFLLAMKKNLFKKVLPFVIITIKAKREKDLLRF